MIINIYGLGYVGCVSAACLAANGNTVTGIDVDPIKVSMINDGKSPIVEGSLEKFVKMAVTSGKLRATLNDIGPADISIVCVGTPGNENGSLNLNSLIRVSEQIGYYLRKIETYHVVNIRSTILPGTIENTIIPKLEEYSKKKVGLDFGLCLNPEFMREGTSIYDFYNPPFSLIGEHDDKSGNVVANMYKKLKAPILRTDIKTAEMVKYACNSFHALKISFANEIGNICKSLGVDSHKVMDIFCKDTKLNISNHYLRPGFAFGGSCLPKDLRAVLYKAKTDDLETPVLNSILQSNRAQIDIAYKVIKKTGKRKIGILGLSFKPGTDDLRESPMVNLVEKLIGKGYEVKIFDREVSIARLFGSNKAYIEQVIPHISKLIMQSKKDLIENSQVVVVGNASDEFKNIILNFDKNKIIIDLVRIIDKHDERPKYYEGICW